MAISNRILCLVFTLIVVCLSGCAPRGETASVDEVLSTARERFSRALSDIDNADSESIEKNIRSAVDSAAQGLEVLVGNAPITQKTESVRAIEQQLASLIPHAGYTSRPTLSEIQKQYVQLAAQMSEAGSAEAATLKLAASRAYSVLASELETTKFGL